MSDSNQNSDLFAGDTLIPVKGIHKVMRAKLRSINIFDAPALLVKGKTRQLRLQLAEKLGVDVKMVDSWVAQINLWRVDGMTYDMAYLLVNMGVCDIIHLAEVSADKVKPILDALVAMQPDFTAVNNIDALITAAESIIGIYKQDFEFASPTHLMKEEVKEDLNTDSEIMNYLLHRNDLFLDIDYKLNLPNALSGYIYLDDFETPFVDAQVEIEGIVGPTKDSVGVADLPSAYTDMQGRFYIAMPERYSLKDEIKIKVTKKGCAQTFVKSAKDVIQSVPETKILERFKQVLAIYKEVKELEALKYRKKSLDQVIFDLEIYWRKSQSSANRSNENGVWYCLPDAERESLISTLIERYNPTEDDLGRIQSCLCNELYSLDPNYTKEVSEIWDIIDGKVGDAVIKAIDAEIQKLYYTSVKGSVIAKELGVYIESEYISIVDIPDEYIDPKREILQSVENRLKDRYDPTGIEESYDRFVRNTYYTVAELKNGETDYLIKEAQFMNFGDDAKVALPSVKLMGNDDKGAVHLSPDVATSKSFEYRMLQRLIAPELKEKRTNFNKKKNKEVTKYKAVERRDLTKPIDILEFRNTIESDADKYAQMGTLGIGYSLNMSQSWIPNGFSLGNLLYSLVLAPGEEQRIIVRENKQSYSMKENLDASDSDSQSYSASQQDNTEVAYQNAIDRLSQADSSQEYDTHGFSIGATGGEPGVFGISAGYSYNQGSSSASATQSDSHDEVSSMAQQFQHSIKSESDRLSQAERVSILTASSSHSESVATKIIANHNHSHVMTIQYWEVMRRYKLETSISGIDLVAFVPFGLINFEPKDEKGNPIVYYKPDGEISNEARIDAFKKRFGAILSYSSLIERGFSYKQRQTLNKIRKFAALSKWSVEKMSIDDSDSVPCKVEFSFSANTLYFDSFAVEAYLKNNIKIIGYVSDNNINTYNFGAMSSKEDIILGLRKYIGRRDNKYVCTITLPFGNTLEDIETIVIRNTFEKHEYTLAQLNSRLEKYQKDALDNLVWKLGHLAADDESSEMDKQRIEHFRSQLPEAYKNYPYSTTVSITRQDLDSFYAPQITDGRIEFIGDAETKKSVQFVLSTLDLTSTTRLSLSYSSKLMRYRDHQEMEELLKHVVSETMRYSQLVWLNLSPDERILLLDKYTLDIDLNDENGVYKFGLDAVEGCKVPLLDCINVRKLLGFYGNCMLFPLTFPKSLAKSLGKTSADIQNELYRYHINAFRAPSNVISLPTDGMVGEAVLSETNVSEKIDITRFWNWQDSPIDKMNIDSNYLSGKDYLDGKNFSEVKPLNITGATAPTAVTAPDLANAMLSKKIQDFDKLINSSDLSTMLTNATNKGAEGIKDTITQATSFVNKDAEIKVAEANAAAAKSKEVSSKNEADKAKSDAAAAKSKEVSSKNEAEIANSQSEKDKAAASKQIAEKETMLANLEQVKKEAAEAEKNKLAAEEAAAKAKKEAEEAEARKAAAEKAIEDLKEQEAKE